MTTKPTIYTDARGNNHDLTAIDVVISVDGGCVSGIWTHQPGLRVLLVDNDDLCDETEGSHNGKEAGERFDAALEATCQNGWLSDNNTWC